MLEQEKQEAREGKLTHPPPDTEHLRRSLPGVKVGQMVQEEALARVVWPCDTADARHVIWQRWRGRVRASTHSMMHVQSAHL